MKKVMPFLLFLGLIFAPSISEAQVKGKKFAKKNVTWEKLGEKKVNIGLEKDIIPVTIQKGVFTGVKFRVKDASVRIMKITIHYGNGESDSFTINRTFEANTGSKVFDLPGNKRIIKRISMVYKTVPNMKGRATVVAFGKH